MWGSKLLIMDRIVEQQNLQEVLSGTEAPAPNSWISRSGCVGWHQDHRKCSIKEEGGVCYCLTHQASTQPVEHSQPDNNGGSLRPKMRMVDVNNKYVESHTRSLMSPSNSCSMWYLLLKQKNV